MGISSTLVNVAEDAEVRLVSLWTDTQPSGTAPGVGPSFQQDCSAQIQAGNAAGLLSTIVHDAGAVPALVSSFSEDDAVAAVSILAALLERVKAENAQEGASLEQMILGKILQTHNTNQADGSQEDADGEGLTVLVERTVVLLSVLYNLRSNPVEKCQLLNRMIETSGRNEATVNLLLSPDSMLGQLLSVTDARSGPSTSSSTGHGSTSVSASLVPTGIASTTQPQLLTWLDMWQVPDPERRELYRCIVNVMPARDVRKQRFLLLLTESYQSMGSPALLQDAQAMQAAKDTAIGAIRDPVSLFAQQRKVMQLAAIQTLQQTEPILFGLLKIFQEGKLSDYQSFLNDHGGESSVLDVYQLDASICQRHMRILSLCSLAAQQEEIPYHLIAETLQLPSENQVESWVIAAVGSGLLLAKMDQLTRTVMVEGCVIRQFDMQQWKELQQKLTSWHSHVGNILANMKQAQAASTSIAPAKVP